MTGKINRESAVKANSLIKMYFRLIKSRPEEDTARPTKKKPKVGLHMMLKKPKGVKMRMSVDEQGAMRQELIRRAMRRGQLKTVGTQTVRGVKTKKVRFYPDQPEQPMVAAAAASSSSHHHTNTVEGDGAAAGNFSEDYDESYYDDFAQQHCGIQ